MFSTLIPKQRNFAALSVAVWRQTGRLAAVWVAVLSLASCAVSPIGDEKAAAGGPDARRKAVETRVNERWAALIKGDLQGSYGYLSPASRETLSFELKPANFFDHNPAADLRRAPFEVRR